MSAIKAEKSAVLAEDQLRCEWRFRIRHETLVMFRFKLMSYCFWSWDNVQVNVVPLYQNYHVTFC